MRVFAFALLTVLLPAGALAGADIAAICYQTCADSMHSNPEYKACVARAADKADQLLNESYKKLQDAVRADAKDMGQSPDVQLGYLKDAQKQWIAYRDSACTFEDSLAFGGTSIGGNYSSCLCALSYERINDFVAPRRVDAGALRALETLEKARILSVNS
jgi:uncharacterized protein YecT (DUF1311 family)